MCNLQSAIARLGYTLAMKAAGVSPSGLPTLLVRSLVARIAAELVA